MLRQLVVDLKDDLLSLDQSKRAKALASMHGAIKGRECDSTTLDYLFEFAVSKVKAEDCLEQCRQIIIDILSVHSEPQRLLAELALLYCPESLSVNVRLTLLDIFKMKRPEPHLFLPQIHGEKDPRCLLQIFSLFTTDILDEHIEPLFEALSPYFPITFKSNLIRSVSEEDLRKGLRVVLAAHPEMAHLSLPFYNDKLATAQNAIVAVECVKGLMASFVSAAESAVSAYHRESINLVVAVLSKDFCEQELTHCIYAFLSTSFTASPLHRHALALIAEHIQFGLSDPKLSMHVPSVIRHVACVNRQAAEFMYTSTVKTMIDLEPTSGNQNKLYSACILAFLCAIYECEYFVFCAEPAGIMKMAYLQCTVLSDRGAKKKDVVFSLSFLEALLRDPLGLGDVTSRQSLIITTFDAIELHSVKLDSSFTTMIAHSIVKHQKETVMEHCNAFLKYTQPVTIQALMSHSETAVLLIDTMNRGNVSPLAFLGNCDLPMVDLSKRLEWLRLYDSVGSEDCVDLIVCSFADKRPLLDQFDTFGYITKRIIAISLPRGQSTVDLLSHFQDDPEVKAALYSKHGEPVAWMDGQTAFCLSRAMILRQDPLVMDTLHLVPNGSELLDDTACRVNQQHHFVCLPTHQQWFMEKMLPDSRFPLGCKLSWIRCCEDAVLKAVNLDPFLTECLQTPSLTIDTIQLFNKLLAIDPFILKNVYTFLTDGLIKTGVTAVRPSTRLAALSALKALLDVISGSAVLPFVDEYVRKLRPALGDAKAAVRATAVQCTDSLYSVLLS